MLPLQIFLLFLLSIILGGWKCVRCSDLVPVVFIHVKSVPLFLQANIELTLRSNPVVFLGDNESLPYQGFLKENNPSVVFADVHSFTEEADSFATIFKHFSHDDPSPARHEYELNCFRRWFILKQYMIANKLSRVFYSDSDSVILRNLTEVSAMERGPCSAIVNIEDQAHNFHWVGSGESSTWTLEALSDLCAFMTSFYTHPEFLSTLERKAKEGGSTVTDMSLIWLWWVARLRDETDGNKIGGPWGHSDSFNKAFQYAKGLPMPRTGDGNGSNIVLCNGMDVVSGSVFDHRHAGLRITGNNGFTSGGNYYFNPKRSPPFGSSASCTTNGGRADPSSKSGGFVFNNIHYQGGVKNKYMVPHICSILKASNQPITNPSVTAACSSVR